MGTTQPWRWTALTSGAGAAAGQPQVSCGSSAVTQHQAAVAAQAASLHAGTAAAPGNHHVATQPGLNYPAQVVWPSQLRFLDQEMSLNPVSSVKRLRSGAFSCSAQTLDAGHWIQ